MQCGRRRGSLHRLVGFAVYHQLVLGRRTGRLIKRFEVEAIARRLRANAWKWSGRIAAHEHRRNTARNPSQARRAMPSSSSSSSLPGMFAGRNQGEAGMKHRRRPDHERNKKARSRGAPGFWMYSARECRLSCPTSRRKWQRRYASRSRGPSGLRALRCRWGTCGRWSACSRPGRA